VKTSLIRSVVIGSLLLLSITFLAPGKAYAYRDDKLDDLSSSLRVYNRSDGLHDVYVQMSQTRSYSFKAFNVDTNYKFYLEIGDSGTEFDISYWNDHSPANNPPEEKYTFDFRDESGSTLHLRVKSGGPPLGWCGLLGGLDCRNLKSVSITFPVGGSGDFYINDVNPTASIGIFSFDLAGSLPSSCGPATCYYRVRLKGTGDVDNWGASYGCTMGPGGRALVVPVDFTCDFSVFPDNTNFTLVLYHGTDTTLGDIISEVSFNNSIQKARILDGPTPIANAVPNDFATTVEVLAAGASGEYKLRIVKSGTLTAVSTSDCSRNIVGVPSVQGFVCDYSYINPTGSYEQVLIDPSGNVVDRKAISLSESPDPVGAGGTCACRDAMSGTDACKVITASSSCWFGFNPTTTSCDVFTCVCDCVFIPGSVGVPLPPLGFDLDDFKGWMAKGQRYLIAFGVFASIFIVPYFGVLLASGNPENIEKGLEWAKSWAFGLLLLLLSSFVIRIIGSDILGF